MGCRTQGTRSLPYFYWLTHTQLLHFLGMKASVIWKNACKVFLTQDILAGADRSQIWFLPSACQLSARDRQHCEQGETVGTEGLDGASVNSLSCLLSQAQNTQHRALLVARDHREMSAPNSKPYRRDGGRTPTPKTSTFKGRVLTRAPFSAVPGCPAHSTAGPSGAPQCRRRQSVAQDETPCVLWPSLPDVQLPRLSQGHLKEGAYRYRLCF